MSDADADASAQGAARSQLGPCIPARAARGPAAAAADDGQQLRRTFLDLRGRIRDARGAGRAGRTSRQLTIALDEEVYQAFQAQCRAHDLSAAMALTLLMSGRELPAARPEVVQLPAVIDAEALHVLHHLEDRIAHCQDGGTLDRGEAVRIRDHLADISAAIGGAPCPCAARDRAHRPGDMRREDA